MIPYSSGLILDSSNNYGIVKTETVFGFSPTHQNYVNDSFNSTEPLEWIITRGNFQRRSLDTIDGTDSRSLKPKTTTIAPKKIKLESKTTKKSVKKKTKTPKGSPKSKKRKGKGKINKCIFKVFKKGDKRKRKQNKYKMGKKFMFPLILGLLAAKSLLIPVALKALAFISAKGLIMGFFSTIMASVLSLKGMFDNHHHYQNRKDEGKTQVEIIQVPSKSEDHIYYDDVHYRRGDFVNMDNYLMPKYKGEEKGDLNYYNMPKYDADRGILNVGYQDGVRKDLQVNHF